MQQSLCFSPTPHNMNATNAFRSHLLKNKPQLLGTLKIGEIVQQISNLFILCRTHLDNHMYPLYFLLRY